MSNLPPEFDLPRERVEAQRRALLAHRLAAARPKRRLRTVGVAVAAAVGIVLVTPALGVRATVLDVFDVPDSVPEPVANRIGVPEGVSPTLQVRELVEGKPYSLYTWVSVAGGRCLLVDTPGVNETTCEGSDRYNFAKGPLLVGASGLGGVRKGGHEFRTVLVSGLAAPEVESVRLVLSDCSIRPLKLGPDGGFLAVLRPGSNKEAAVAPDRVEAWSGGTRLASKAIAGPIAATGGC